MSDPLLAPAELELLRRLRVTAGRVSVGRAGQHAARGHGSSLDFDDYRPYQPGDDPRRVDRHAWLRTGRLLLKLFEAEDEVGVQVVLDTSSSMAFGDKPTVACRLAAAVTVAAVLGGDRARLVVAAPTGVEVGPWWRGRPAVGPLLARLAGLRDELDARRPEPVRHGPDGREELVEAITRCLPTSRRGPVVAVGDLLTPRHGDVLRVLGAARAGAVALQVLGRLDLEPWLEDDPELVDVDYGTRVEAADTPAARRRLEDRRDAWLDTVAADAAACRVRLVRVVDDAPADEQLLALPTAGVVA